MRKGVESQCVSGGLYKAQVFPNTFQRLMVHLKLEKYYSDDTQRFETAI